MATMNSVIEQVDRLNPNIYLESDKYGWMNTLDGLVAREVMGQEAPAYKEPDDADKELLVPYPYDDLYPLYMSAMIYFYNREYDHYNNVILQFNARYEQFKAWYIRNNKTCKAQNFRNVMG